MPPAPIHHTPARTAGLSRRALLTATTGGLAGLVLAGCRDTAAPAGQPPTPRAPTAADMAAIRAAEANRPHTGRTRRYRLTPQHTEIDLGGRTVRTQAYGDTIPGRTIHANLGDELAVTVHNRLDRATSVHWHGIALRNDMDGVEPATPDIAAGDTFTYRFSVPNPGTYWAHPHVGLDTDYGLYLPVIVHDPNEPAGYDADWVVVLDDWTDGIGANPQAILDNLQANGMPSMGGMDHGASPTPTPSPSMSGMPEMGGMAGMDHGASPTPTPSASEAMGGGRASVGSSRLLGGDAGDVAYPLYLVNGRRPQAPATFKAKPGQRIRIRIINAGADTAFRVALAGHTMTVTHTDGYPIRPTDVDALLLGMGERYDVVVTLNDGVFPLVASAEGKTGLARALIRTSTGSAPAANVRPTELTGRVGTVATFTADPSVRLANTKPDTSLAAVLGGDMASYRWTINGRTFDHTQPLLIRQGQRARLTFTNNTMMWHPMHLHGHTFQVRNNDDTPGPRKDTVIVLPKQALAVDLIADNPGDWMLHCHNAYHQSAGMMTQLNYRT